MLVCSPTGKVTQVHGINCEATITKTVLYGVFMRHLTQLDIVGGWVGFVVAVYLVEL